MSAWKELAEGEVGREATTLLYLCVRAVALARNFPPPAGHVSWSVDAVQSVAHEFLTGPRGLRRLTECALRADDDDSLRRLLEKAVLNHLRDEARRSERGRLARRLRELVLTDDRFGIVPPGRPGAGNVVLLSTPGHKRDTDGEVYQGLWEDLVPAAFSVRDVTLVRWRPDASREAAPADADSLLRVSETVLQAAGGGMRLPDLAAVVSRRFALGDAPLIVDADDTDEWAAEKDTPGAADPSVVVAVEESAARITGQLTRRERSVLALLDSPLRDIAARTGLSKSTVATVATRVRGMLEPLLRDEPQLEQVLRRVMDLCHDDAFPETVL